MHSDDKYDTLLYIGYQLIGVIQTFKREAIEDFGAPYEPDLTFTVHKLPKNFRFSKKKRIRKKQEKRFISAIYKGCKITAVNYES